MLVYDVTNWESFQKLDRLKKDIDKYKDKKEVSVQLKRFKSCKTLTSLFILILFQKEAYNEYRRSKLLFP